jgi:hypothetical protein
VGNGFPTVPVHDLKMHPRDRELIVGTHGRSLWIIDVAPLQQLTPGASRPRRHPCSSSPRRGWRTAARPWPAHRRRVPRPLLVPRRQPPFGAEIVWYKPGTVHGAPCRSSSPTPAAIPVQVLNGSGTQGMQRVLWNLRGRPAPVAGQLSPSERRDSLAPCSAPTPSPTRSSPPATTRRSCAAWLAC